MTTVLSSIDTNANVINYFNCSEDSKIANTTKSIPSCNNNEKSVCANTKKSVYFNPVVHGRPVLHIKDYSVEEKRSNWYTDLEYDAFTVEIMTTVLIMTRGGPPILGNDEPCCARGLESASTVLLMMRGGSRMLGNGEKYCAHGLESATRDGSSKKRWNKLHSRSVVIDEQVLQNARGHQECDDQILARIYLDCTRHCQYEAHEKALALRAALLDQWYAQADDRDDKSFSEDNVKIVDLLSESRRRRDGLRRQSSSTRTMISTAAA
jgi:hypothetical protein